MWSGGALGGRHTSAGQLPPTRDHPASGSRNWRQEAAWTHSNSWLPLKKASASHSPMESAESSTSCFKAATQNRHLCSPGGREMGPEISCPAAAGFLGREI